MRLRRFFNPESRVKLGSGSGSLNLIKKSTIIKPMRAIYPGSFDPITLGHLDIIKRASKIFRNITILVSEHPDKKERIPLAKRIALIERAVAGIENLDIKTTSGLTVSYALENGYNVIIRGIRGASDFESELEMSQINSMLSGGLETVFMMTSPQYSYIRSSRVWELLKFGGDISNLVPASVNAELNHLADK